jgi:hypothetical protein
MKKLLDLTLSQDLESRLIRYHEDLTKKARLKYRLPRLADVKHIAVRKKALLGFYGSKMLDWQYKVLIDYGKNHAWKECFPFIEKIVNEYTIPQMEKSYDSKIERHQLFSPCYYNEYVYNFSLTYFNKSLFKGKNTHFGKVEKHIAEFFSLTFREKNKRGPENTVATIFDNQFLAISSRGILTPFSLEYVRLHDDAEKVCQKMMYRLVDKIIGEINKNFFSTVFGELFVQYDVILDELHVLVFLDQDKWDEFFSYTIGDQTCQNCSDQI